MNNGNGNLGHLLHADGVGSSIGITSLAETEMKKCFVRALESDGWRQARKFTHHADEADARHARDERIVFRHVADRLPDFARLCSDIHPEDASGTFVRLMKP